MCVITADVIAVAVVPTHVSADSKSYTTSHNL